MKLRPVAFPIALLLAVLPSGSALGFAGEPAGEVYLEQRLDAIELGEAETRAAQPSVALPSALPPGRIFGRVIDESTGQPIAAAWVMLHPFGRTVAPLSIHHVPAQADGTFAFDDLDPGYYFLSATGYVDNDRPYQPRIFPDVSCDLDCRNVTDGALLTIGLGDDPPELELALRSGASLSGTLHATDGALIRSALVSLYDTNKVPVAYGFASASGQGSSDLEYRVDGLAPGDYFVAIRARAGGVPFSHTFFARSLSGNACGLGNCMQPADAVSLSEAEQLAGLDFTLSHILGAPGPLHGLAIHDGVPDDLWVGYFSYVDADGTLLGIGAPRAFVPDSTPYMSFAPNYVFNTMTSPVRVFAATPYRIENDETIAYQSRAFPDIDCNPALCVEGSGPVVPSGTVVELTLAGGISGRVTDRQLGQPIPWVDVAVYDLDGNFVGGGKSDESGDYVVLGLADGTYRVSTANGFRQTDGAWPGIRCNGSCTPEQGDPVSIVGAGMVAEIDLVIGGGFFAGDFE